MPSQSRTVRVFLSSTFRDFAEERDLLVRKVFPELRRKCRERQVELVDVDLRWGITEEEAQQGKVLPICLAEIDRSRPFFMGFIGERYGWVPEAEKYDLSLIMEQPWLDEHRGGKSVTELEILHGVLNNPAMEDRAFFYFRDPAWSQKKGGAYLSEGSAEKQKLEALKDRIRQSGYPVVEDYPTPEALAERVKEDLWKLIDEAFPASEVPDALAQERMRHEAFAASRLGLYIGGEKYFEALDAAMAEEPCKPILVCGASGGGKSALLANWAQRFSSAHPEAIVLTHFLGTGADVAHPVNMAIRLLREMARITGEEFVLEGDPRKALRMLGEWFEKAGAFARERGGVFVLVLDALDKMTEHRDLDWWPRKLPEGVAMVVSCLDGDVRDTIARRMEWTEVRVSPLEPIDCERFMEDHLAKYRKAVTPEQKALILAHPLCGNPLFLRTLLEELRVFGVHEELNRRLQHYLASETIDDLFEKVLDRIESDNTPESVRAALEVLWAAKESFAEDELLTVSQLPPAVWAPIHIALDESLIGAGGRLAFSHDYLRKAVEDRYLDSEVARQSIQKRMAAFCAQAMAGGRKEISRYVRRHAVEHFLEVGDWDNATAALSDLEFIEARAIAQELSAMLKDYAEAVKLLPEGEKERQTEAARQAELDRYAKEMYEYSAAWSRIRDGSGEAEPTLPCPAKSVRLWTEEEIADERKRMTETPDRLDIIKAFRIFVATNSGALQAYSSQEGFAANLARNDAPAGPVHEEGKRRLEPMKCIKLIKHFAIDEIYNPIPACTAILEGHINYISSISLDSYGSHLVSGSLDNTIRVWDIVSGQCLKILNGHRKCVSSIVLNADSSQIVSGSYDRTIRIWDFSSGECLRTLQGHEDSVSAIALSSNGKHLFSGSWDKTIRIWDILTGECLRTLQGHEDSVSAMALSSDGKHIFSGSWDKTIRIWDISTGECVRVIKTGRGGIRDLALSTDGKFIFSACMLHNISVFDCKKGKCIRVLTGHTAPVSSIACSADGTIVVSGSWDQTVRIWNFGTGECHRVLEGHAGMPGNDVFVRVSADCNQIISGCSDTTIRVWDSARTSFTKCPYRYERYSNIQALSPDGNSIISNCEDSLHITDAKTAELKRSLFDDLDTSTVSIFSADGQFIASGDDEGIIRIWNTSSGQIKNILEGHTRSISALAFSADARRIVSGSKDCTLRVWDTKTSECLKVFDAHTTTLYYLHLSSDGKDIISGINNDTIRVWHIETGLCTKFIEGHAKSVNSIIVSPDGRQIVSGSRDKTLRVWDIKSGKCIKILEGHAKSGNPIIVSPDGRHIFSGGLNQTIRVWDIESGQCIRMLEGHTSSVESLFMDPGGQCIISNDSGNTIKIWKNKTYKLLCNIYIRGKRCIIVNSMTSMLIVGFYDDHVESYSLENLPLAPFITTAHREIISEDLPAGPVTARPPCCGQLISISSTIADCIEYWALDGGDGGYTDPALLLDCPNCATPLRMNPFFVNI